MSEYMIERIVNFLYLLIVIKNLFKFNNFRNGFKLKKKANVDRAFVLCTGPSLKNLLPFVSEEDVSVAVNFFAVSDEFLRVKPKYYCLVDPAFSLSNDIVDQTRYDEVRMLYQRINDVVNWKMIIVVPSDKYKLFVKNVEISNPLIQIVPINTTSYQGCRIIRNYLYKKNYAVPLFQTVAITALYVAANIGCKEIVLTGAEHGFMHNWSVDVNNNLYIGETHYDVDDTKYLMSPQRGIIKDSHSYVREQLAASANIFRGHELMREYADSIGCRIINTTLNSMIDVYEKDPNYIKSLKLCK